MRWISISNSWVVVVVVVVVLVLVLVLVLVANAAAVVAASWLQYRMQFITLESPVSFVVCPP